MTIFPSACMWNCDRAIVEALRQIKETAFHYVDVDAKTLSVTAAVQACKDLGLRVSCVALDHDLPRGVSLDARDAAAARKTVEYLREAISRGRDAGARYGYVTPCKDKGALARFESSIVDLADAAASCGIRLCVEHTPGRVLPTVRQLRSFTERLNHSNLFMLLDVGHTLLSRERPSEAVATAGGRLGYVQMNDNDARKDRHWPLLEGKLTLVELRATVAALQQAGYEATFGLDVKPDFGSWISGMSKNRNLLLRLQETAEAKSFKEPETRRKA